MESNWTDGDFSESTDRDLEMESLALRWGMIIAGGIAVVSVLVAIGLAPSLAVAFLFGGCAAAAGYRLNRIREELNNRKLNK